MSSVTESLLMIFILLAVMFAAWYASKHVASGMRRFSRSKYLEILDQLYIGRDRIIILIKAGKKAYLVGVTQNGMEAITDIPIEDLESLNVIEGQEEFSSIIKACINRYNPFRSKIDE